MEWIVTTGRSIEEAKEAALDQLGVAEDEAEFEIEEEPKPGLFGRLRKEARVRARVRPVQPRPKVERKRSDRGKRKSEGDAPPKRSSSSRDGDQKKKRPAKPRSDDAGAPSAPEKPARTKEVSVTTIDIPLGEHAERMQTFIEGLVEVFGYEETTVERTEIDDENAEIHVEGEELGLLIGPKGQTLAAIQTLARAAVQSQREAHFEGRVNIDVSGYRQRRKAALEQFALKLANEVADTGVEKGLEPMGSADRKIVHDIVGTVEGVATISVGEDPRRRVVITPAGD